MVKNSPSTNQLKKIGPKQNFQVPDYTKTDITSVLIPIFQRFLWFWNQKEQYFIYLKLFNFFLRIYHDYSMINRIFGFSYFKIFMFTPYKIIEKNNIFKYTFNSLKDNSITFKTMYRMLHFNDK